MITSSIIIYLGENPVSYDLFIADGSLELKPAPDTVNNLIPPIIIATTVKNGWEINGVPDTNVKAQVMKLIEINALISLREKVSAAS